MIGAAARDDDAVLRDALRFSEAVAAHDDSGHVHDGSAHDHRIRAFALRFEQPLDWTMFGIWLSMLLAARGEDVLRVKGLLNAAGSEGPVVVNGVQHVIHPPVHLAAWPDEDHSSRLVLIVREIAADDVERSLLAFQDLASAVVSARQTSDLLEVTMASAPAAVSYETLAKAPDTYFKAVDAMDIEGVMACFADDATLTVQTDHVTFTGAAEIRRMFTDFFGASVSIGHEIRNIVVEPGARQGRDGAGVLRRAQGRLQERHAQLQLLRLRRGRQVHPRDHLDGGHEPAAIVEALSRSSAGGSSRSQASAAASTVASLRPENITPSRVVADGQPSQLNGRTRLVTRAR